MHWRISGAWHLPLSFRRQLDSNMASVSPHRCSRLRFSLCFPSLWPDDYIRGSLGKLPDAIQGQTDGEEAGFPFKPFPGTSTMLLPT